MKLTYPMFKVLDNLMRGKSAGCHCRGMSEFGGLTRTLAGLRRRELIDADHNVTDAGKLAYVNCPWSPDERKS